MAYINTFAGSPVDRAANFRRDDAWVRAHLDDPETRFLPLWQLRPLMALGDPLTIAWRSTAEVAPFLDQGVNSIFLGLIDGRAHFAVDVSIAGSKKADAPFADLGKWIDVRSAATSASQGDAAILAQSRSMIDWHARHGFCAVCGKPSQMREAGYARKCTDDACGAMHFPRTDPVTIMLVLHGDNCLLGRQKIFAPKSYSALAGFVEPGETIEEAVRREVEEEVGITVGDVRYIFSQPWPFPSSLMIGCFGYAETTEINVDPVELEDARWFTRDEIAAMVENWRDQSKLRMPAPLAIAHQLARAWISGD